MNNTAETAPNKKHFVNNLVDNVRFDSFFYVEEKELRTSRQGKPYLDLKLRDRTGFISAKIWEGAASLNEQFGKDDYVKVRATQEMYQNNPQLKIEMIRKADISEVNIGDYIPVSEREPGEMLSELQGFIDSIQDIWIKEILDSFLKDESFMEQYMKGPAAKSLHHAYLGGLPEHTLSMMRICDYLAVHYTDLNRDLLLAGAFLHDIGKIREITPSSGFPYSTEGELTGHIVIGSIMISEKAAAIDGFPQEILNLLLHMVLSHHGEPEFGAVKRPVLREAVLLHYVDNIDAKMNMMTRYMAEKNHSQPDELWSDKCLFMDGRRFLRIDKYYKPDI
ncbi:MAG: HD domain-containing protein [Firmicutes bacterium]|nr:HD domain-containing protein [Bacillota bacterium]